MNAVSPAVSQPTPEGTRAEPSIGQIVLASSDHFGIPVNQIMGERGSARVAQARQLAMSLAMELTGAQTERIARYFNRDHKTVMHAANVVPGRVASYPDWQEGDRAIRLALDLAPPEAALPRSAPPIVRPKAAPPAALGNTTLAALAREVAKLVLPMVMDLITDFPETDHGRRPIAKTRVCLCCNKPFGSQGAHNRICPPCVRINQGVVA